MRICVVALGKIGLPLAVQFARKGHRVIGADVDERVVADVNAGREPFPGEADLGVHLGEAVRAGLLTATTDTAAAVAGAEAVVVVVPLFVDGTGTPDFGWMDAATRSIAEGMRPGTLVSYETTLPVGTTRNRWAPILAEGSGLTAGEDFHLVFSPERVLTGRVFADLRRYPKLVGGIDEASARHGVAFYEQVLDFDDRPDLDRPNGVWDLGSAEAAELAKLAETTYRDVNIGLANQFARYARQRRGGRHQGHRGLQHPAVQPHPPARHRRRRPLHPGVSAAVPVERPVRDRRPRRPGRQPGHARVRRRPAGRRLRRPHRRRGPGAGRGVSRRRQGDGVLRRLPDGRGAQGPRRRPVRVRPAVLGGRAGGPRPSPAPG
ncbi:hypothetical protein LUX32_24735 [Actinomadura madurae]|nr:hypothetical protein [Actinomadura madurae]MCP9980452.1 hypothetical protein [Actinomadura madurae]